MAKDIPDSVRQQVETSETERRKRAVRDAVPPPKNVGLADTERLAFEEKATRMFPTLIEEARRKLGMAPYAAEPRGRSLDWWRR